MTKPRPVLTQCIQFINEKWFLPHHWRFQGFREPVRKEIEKIKTFAIGVCVCVGVGGVSPTIKLFSNIVLNHPESFLDSKNMFCIWFVLFTFHIKHFICIVYFSYKAFQITLKAVICMYKLPVGGWNGAANVNQLYKNWTMIFFIGTKRKIRILNMGFNC